METFRCFASLLERKAYSCDTARRRAEEAGLSNARIRCEALHEFATAGDDEDGHEDGHEGGGGSGSGGRSSGQVAAGTESGVNFDLGISLHSCGLLTDGALELCMVRVSLRSTHRVHHMSHPKRKYSEYFIRARTDLTLRAKLDERR